MHCYRYRHSVSREREWLYFAKRWEDLPEGLRNTNALDPMEIEAWDMTRVAVEVEQHGFAVWLRSQMEKWP